MLGRYSKKQAKRCRPSSLKNCLHGEDQLSHANALLEEAHVLRSEKGEASGDYNQIREWLLGHVPRLGNTPVYEILPYESISIEVLTDSQIQKLLAHPVLAGWIAQPDKLKSVADEVDRAEKSDSSLWDTKGGSTKSEDSIRQLYDETAKPHEAEAGGNGKIFLEIREENLARICLDAPCLSGEDSLLKVNAFLSTMEKSLLLYFSRAGFSDASGRRGASPSRILVP
jgi:hypothetical protein